MFFLTKKHKVLQPDVERHEVEVVPEDGEEQQPKQQTGTSEQSYH